MSRLELVARPWRELGRDELYEVLRLRAAVFVVEQACPFLDPDGRDPEATHLLGRLDGALVAYARWLPVGGGELAVHLGRIVTAPSVRGHGYGRQLVAAALARLGGQEVGIHAQARLEGFYRDLGFVVAGAAFVEDGIQHLPMVRGPRT